MEARLLNGYMSAAAWGRGLEVRQLNTTSQYWGRGWEARLLNVYMYMYMCLEQYGGGVGRPYFTMDTCVSQYWG